MPFLPPNQQRQSMPAEYATRNNLSLRSRSVDHFASAPRINRAARNGRKSVRGDRLHDGSRAAVGNESVPIQLAQCRFPGLAIFTLKYKYIFK